MHRLRTVCGFVFTSTVVVDDPNLNVLCVVGNTNPALLRDKPESDMKEFIEFIARHLVEDPDQVEVTVDESEKGLLFRLIVGEKDIGRVVGKEGRTARSLRTLLTAVAARRGQRANLEIVDDNSEER